MLVFWEQKLVFLATPKTGSTAIEAALESLAALVVQRPPILKHTTAQRYRRFLDKYLEVASGEKFTVVALMREPTDWLGSWYRYRQRDDILDPTKSTIGRTFEEFVEGYIAQPQEEFANVGSQARFLSGKNGDGVDRIFRYEEINTFVEFLEDRLNCEIILPRLNVSPEASLDLSSGLEGRLREFAKEDYALYGRLSG